MHLQVLPKPENYERDNSSKCLFCGFFTDTWLAETQNQYTNIIFPTDFLFFSFPDAR